MCLRPALGPRRDQATWPFAVVWHGPTRTYNRGGSPREVISGLDHTALALAVYASQCGSHRPTQDSLLAACQLYQAGLATRRVPTKGFRDVSHPFLLSLASWRNVCPEAS